MELKYEWRYCEKTRNDFYECVDINTLSVIPEKKTLEGILDFIKTDESKSKYPQLDLDQSSGTDFNNNTLLFPLIEEEE